MVGTSLTPKLIEEGAALVQALDKAGVSPDAAFWFYSSDIQGWKLVLAEMKLGPEGPRKIYRQIQRTLSSLPQDDRAISLDDVAVAKPDAPIVAVLKRAVRTGPGVSGIRFTQNVVDGILIEDAYIYRLAKPAA
jgi:hypothetical protein